MKKFYRCVKCQTIYPFNRDILTCPKHSKYYGYLTLIYDYKNVKLGNDKNVFKKYKNLFPLEEFEINFNEQKTPLIKLNKFGVKHELSNLYVKDESKNPTGSFKDKESLFAINMALKWEVSNIFVVSSGNAAISTAAYAQKAGLKYTSYVPKNLSVGKRFLIGLYGGLVKEINGNYEEIYRKAIDMPFPGWNCTPGLNPIKEEGIKVIGFEIFEEIGVPDVIIAPCGNGTLLFGLFKAFKELSFLGVTTKMPKFLGVQIRGASPLKSAFEQQEDFVKLNDIPSSIAEGIVAEESYSSPKVMYALEDTGGEIIEVSDSEITQAIKEIIKTESIIPEPTSAVAYAAIEKVNINKNDKVVLINTAGGQKNLKEIMQLLIKAS
ncbi:MAG: threonine synthase [uncultured bacterium]|nr:MAG: threonine synthase [uncultured bacterium]KKR15676.1 MAG: Threonine synthase [Candidatus Levybacteria bacterium GW2011_GWA1_39_34]KKR49682.1 MAG: threonine synthase, threonine synthase [Candidatus Levybacteria bacterium GW2011_GWC1_40_19]KKR94954.1 MAG: Threonine synthase [Candidatus Levybacteria bacterium GW2011_GWA2_41_15]KKS00237.1 MAG: Threonine synthase [Candidatus Levybacteria bacterium GW2011_GWB1_41_21]OGH20889.1 MAG: hypothetical protein A2695_00365 [Candidatus Levybacteria bac